MKLIECVNAYTALGLLMQKETDFRSAYALAGLRRRLAPHAMFYSGEELKLMREYAKKDEHGQPVFTGPREFVFRDSEAGAKFKEKLDELAAVELEEEFSPITVKAPGRTTPEVIFALEGLVNFEEDGK